MEDPVDLPDAEYDGPWKDALEWGLDLFLQHFLPQIYHALDWTHDFVAKNNELQRLFPAAQGTLRRVDALFQLTKLTGDLLHLHLEVQAYFDLELGPRTMTYRHRLRDWLKGPVVSIVIFADANPDWCPNGHSEGEFASEDRCTWLPIKLLPLRDRLGELESSTNVFCLFVAGHLEAQRTRQDLSGRRVAKLRLLSNLLDRELDPEDMGEWYRLLDWLLRLPPDEERKLHEEIRQLRGDASMKFMNYWERQGLEKGLEQGLEKGREQGLEKGREQGYSEGARQVLQAILKTKFGDEGLPLASHLEQDVAPERVERLTSAVLAATTIDELRALIGNGATKGTPEA